MKISNFWKIKFPSIKFPFIDDFALNIHEINDFLKFWPLMDFFFGLYWHLLAFLVFLALDEFFKQRPAFGNKK